MNNNFSKFKIVKMHWVKLIYLFSAVQSLSLVWLCDPMNCSTPGLPFHRQLPEFTQTHIHLVGDAIQSSHPLSSPSPPVPNPSQSSQCTSPKDPVSNLDWWFISYMILYMFPWHSPKSSHPLPLPQSPKDCSILFCCLSYRVIITIFNQDFNLTFLRNIPSLTFPSLLQKQNGYYRQFPFSHFSFLKITFPKTQTMAIYPSLFNTNNK